MAEVTPERAIDRREFLTAALALPLTPFVGGGRPAPPPGPSLERLGASTACLAGLPLIDAIGHIQRLRFGTLELIAYTGARHSIGDIPGFSYQNASPLERGRVFAATRAFPHITAHLPFQGLQLLSSAAAERRTAMARIEQALDGLAYLKGELGVMHVGWPEKGKQFRDVWQPMIDTLRSLGDYAGARGIDLGVETMQPDSARDYADLFTDVDHPHVGAAVDTGHIRGSTDIGLPQDRRDTAGARARFNDVLNRLVKDLGPKVLHVHLSDVRRTDWADHRTIGSGIVDFPRLFATLREMQYKRLFVLELEEPDPLGALERSRAHVEPLLAKL